MAGKIRDFYADNIDILNLLECFDRIGNFKYVEIYSDLNKESDVFHSALKMYNKCICTPEFVESRQSFSIFEIEANLIFSEIYLSDGSGKRTSLQGLLSDDSIEICFGGEVGDNTLVMSNISTVAHDKAVLNHYKQFKNLIESKSVRIGPPGQPSYLMHGALEKAKRGWRLAQAKGWDPASDPVLPPEHLAKL